MYSAIGAEFVSGSQPSAMATTSDDREKFLDTFLAEYLNTEKVRERASLREKLKYKHHQLELAAKQMRIAERKKRDQEALATGQTHLKPKSVRGPKALSFKTRKSLRLFDLNKKESLDYTKYEQINQLWHSYASSCLTACLGAGPGRLSESSVLNCLKQMDYHGCSLRVVKSSVKSLIGVSGLVVQEKKNVFCLLTKANRVKIVPKCGSLFEFELMGFCRMRLVGSNVCVRPEMRSTKHAKIKTRDVK
jgi:RNase P/RNase MRP subunit p29